MLIANRDYVTSDEKKILLREILRDYQLASPHSKGMTFQQILYVLRFTYGIHTRTIGNFFKHQLKDYKTMGGNRLKYVLFEREKTCCVPSISVGIPESVLREATVDPKIFSPIYVGMGSLSAWR